MTQLTFNKEGDKELLQNAQLQTRQPSMASAVRFLCDFYNEIQNEKQNEIKKVG